MRDCYSVTPSSVKDYCAEVGNCSSDLEAGHKFYLEAAGSGCGSHLQSEVGSAEEKEAYFS